MGLRSYWTELLTSIEPYRFPLLIIFNVIRVPSGGQAAKVGEAPAIIAQSARVGGNGPYQPLNSFKYPTHKTFSHFNYVGMSAQQIQHRRTHNLLLISKLLNGRDSASPFTLVVDSLEQSGRPLLREIIKRAKVCF